MKILSLDRAKRLIRKAWVVPVIGMLIVVGQSEARAAGLLIADGGLGGVLEIEEHTAHVTINNGVAVTHVTQVFRNTEKRQVEALYLFPVPKGASVANFSMWINGKEMIGEVLEKQRAREIYNSYKQERRDPGLLEQADYKTFEMRIFPIGPEARQKVQITYYQELDFDHDWATYVYPLATAPRPGLNAKTEGKFSLSVDVKSGVPIVEMESPSHDADFVIASHADSYYQASLETEAGDLARDVVLAYHVSKPRTGMDLIASKQSGEDGYFQLTITAGEELAARNSGMDYVFIVDISGSMAHDGKLRMSRESVGAFIDALDTEDRFEVITFNVSPQTLFNQLEPAGEQAHETARKFLATQQARGGTVLRTAMATAYKYADADRPLNVVILSDGMTERRERTELLSLIQTRPRNGRVFCIGVGNEVDRPLLNQLAEDAGGLAAFISRGDNFSRQAKAFRRKLTRPAGSEVNVNFQGLDVYDVEPKKLPNLYHGMPIRIYGRYKNGASGEVQLRADVNGAPFAQTVSVNLPKAEDANPEIERMWASHKIDQLLRTADRNGSRKTVTDEIVRLGEEYSIVTEYTSFLVLENDGEYKRWKIERRNLNRIARDRLGQAAVQKRLEQLRSQALSDLGPKSNGADQEVVASRQPRRNPASAPNVTNRPSVPINSQPTAAPGRGPGFGGGGAVEWVFLAGLGLMGAGRWCGRRKEDDPTEAVNE